MNSLNVTLTLVLIFFALTACEKKAEEETPVVYDPPVVDYSIPCTEHFHTHWCSGNLTDSEIEEVCAGEVILGDTTIQGISLKTSTEQKCFIETQISEPTSFSGCAQAKNQQYVEDFQGVNPFNAVVCTTALGRPAYIEGVDANGVSFRALNIN